MNLGESKFCKLGQAAHLRGLKSENDRLWRDASGEKRIRHAI
jgi:hypothetical protein